MQMMNPQVAEFELTRRGWAGMRWVDTSTPLGLVLPIGLAVMAGGLCAVAPWWIAVGLLLGSAVLALTAFYPLVGIVLTFMLAFQAIPASLAPDIPLGFFKLKPYELVFLWTIGAYLVRMLVSRDAGKLQTPMFTLPMLFILFWVLVGVIYGKLFAENGNMVIAEARGFLGLLVAPMVQLIVQDRRDLTRLLAWISITGIILSIFIVVQAMTGMKILDGRVEALDQGSNSDITRTVVPGVAIQAFALYYLSLSLFSEGRFRFWLVPFLLILLLGLLATFGRGAWMTAAMGGLVVAYLAGRWRGLLIAILLGGFMVFATVGTAYVIKPRVAEAAIERALGIGHELSAGGSWGWRKQENERALEVISQNPLLGVGIGGEYKKMMVAQDPSFAMEAQFIHNSYLFFPLKMGVIAGLGPFLIAMSFLILLFRINRQTSGKIGPAVAASAGVVAITFVGAVSGPVLKSFPGLLALGTVLAICAIVYRQLQPSPPVQVDAMPAKPVGAKPRMALDLVT